MKEPSFYKLGNLNLKRDELKKRKITRDFDIQSVQSMMSR
jgi:hypothetical protein